MEVQEEGHGRGEAQGELQPLGAAVMHPLDLDVDTAFKWMPLPLLSVPPLPYGLGRRGRGGEEGGKKGGGEEGGGREVGGGEEGEK